MTKYLKPLIYTLPLLFLSVCAQAASLDDLYRDIIRSDNQGYLPLFVKNRQAPDMLTEALSTQKIPLSQANHQGAAPLVSLHNPIPERVAAQKAQQLKWERTLRAIEQNRITPLELDEVHHRLHKNDPKAIEVLAWMYTKGVGVQIDYVEAYKLYRQAARLNVPRAQENALLVFKSMTEEQRRRLKTD